MMSRKMDPNLAIEIQHDIAEVGSSFECVITRSPVDGETNTKVVGQIRAVRISLRFYTEGRGDTDQKTVEEAELPVDQYGMAKGTIRLTVPIKGPISYDGPHIRVRWEIVAQTDIKFGIDQKSSAEVLVVPRGGLGTYDRPHPLSVRA